MEFFTSLGIDWKLFLAQIINFGILLFVLQRFLYKPMLSFLSKREQSIKDNLDLSEELKTEKVNLDLKKDEVLSEARKEAHKIIHDAKVFGEKEKTRLMTETQKEIKEMLAQKELAALREKDQILRDAKGEIIDLIMLATENIIKQKLDPQTDRILIEKTLRELDRAK